MMSTTYLNIGSNQGDRYALIEQAIALIANTYPQANVRRSDFVLSEPWGYESTNTFVNIGIALDMAEQPDPLEMLTCLQSIERRIGSTPHRNADGSYRDRDIDIDIIAIDDLRIDTPRLTLPHPHALSRPFVLIPLQQLLPAGLSPSQICHVK